MRVESMSGKGSERAIEKPGRWRRRRLVVDAGVLVWFALRRTKEGCVECHLMRSCWNELDFCEIAFALQLTLRSFLN